MFVQNQEPKYVLDETGNSIEQGCTYDLPTPLMQVVQFLYSLIQKVTYDAPLWRKITIILDLILLELSLLGDPNDLCLIFQSALL